MATWDDEFQRNRQRAGAEGYQPGNKVEGPTLPGGWMSKPQPSSDLWNYPGAASPPRIPQNVNPSAYGWNPAAPSQPSQPAAPAAPQAQRDRSNDPWGTFGVYGNWARAFEAQHARPPTAQDEADFWDSQLYARQTGQAPGWGEWNNRYYTGDWWTKPNYRMIRSGGMPNMEGRVPTEAFTRATQYPWTLPNWLQGGFVPWYQEQSGRTLPTAPWTNPAGPPAAPQMATPDPYQRGPGMVGRR